MIAFLVSLIRVSWERAYSAEGALDLLSIHAELPIGPNCEVSLSFLRSHHFFFLLGQQPIPWIHCSPEELSGREKKTKLKRLYTHIRSFLNCFTEGSPFARLSGRSYWAFSCMNWMKGTGIIQQQLCVIVAAAFSQVRYLISYYRTAYKSISKSLFKFHSVNYHLESHVHKNRSLYIFTLQQFFYILFTL